ncbi:SARP family transcriptional regulator [Lentzea pudingi]|uniref:SARP family transcriptional regulator n=1 Tax=Lentzea pudingi TaxID=1789439 RepID=A0ABQ2IT71_9PSEU|nr:SARP family transcriptional regulator [Lentzea pudingi]
MAVLLVHRGRPVSVNQLVDALWGGTPSPNYVRTLRSKVSLLRRTLENAEPGSYDLIETRPPGYLLRVEDGAVDAGCFDALLRQAQAIAGDPRAKSRLLTEAAGLWRGATALADCTDEEFVQAESRRLEERRLVALEELAEARLELGEHAVLAGELSGLVAAHPMRERLRAVHVRALYVSGRQDEALASLAELRDRLRDELGLDPGRALTGLHEAILRQDAALTPAAAHETRSRGSLPVPLTELIGRLEDAQQVGALLTSERLVTLTGVGGVGKTRLALEVATRRAGTHFDGTRLVELAMARTAAEVHEAVATALGLREDLHAPARSVPELLADALAGQDVLLVLDNCEHVIEPVAEIAAQLLRAAPALRVLATSQEPLSIVGERVRPVAPLDLPEPDVDRLQQSTAVQLFVARAAAAAPDFRFSSDNAEAVATICRRLDGIPLALEMAAAQLRGMSVADLAARLDDRFRVLTAPLRAAPARQRTLRATIDWSWDLLSKPEQVLLRRLAAFADGCVLEAAEAVCVGGPVSRDDVVLLLGRLVDRSMVSRQGGRYRLLESVAIYCADRLAEADDEDERRDRHLSYYLDFAERADVRLRGHEQRLWLEQLSAEVANIRAALLHAVSRTFTDAALRLANAFAWFCFLRGRFAEALRSLDLALSDGGSSHLKASARAWQTGMSLLLGTPETDSQVVLELYETVEDPAGRARALWFIALCRAGFGDPVANLGLAHRARAGFEAQGDRWGIAAALSVNAELLLYLGDQKQARANATQAQALFREVGDRWGQLQAAYTLGDLAEIAGNYGTAEHLRHEAHQLAQDLKLWNDVSKMLARLGRVALLVGDLDRANELHNRARQLAATYGYQRGEEFAEIGMGLVARRQDRFDDAETHFNAWLDWCRKWDSDHGVAFILAELGFIAEQRGDADAARKHHQEGLEHARRTGDLRAIALALEGLAGAEALAGAHSEAARLLGVAFAARDAIGVPLPAAERGDVDRITEIARTGLTSEAYEHAFEQGSCLTATSAVAWTITSRQSGDLTNGDSGAESLSECV